ncbi:Deoxyribodipyrimidine photolyase [Halalkaliarchaeum sp. AArc-CO]|uniref:cryptochrome/photolyase family protein n=1 Tax=Halalkaliarchaeum sp. AArc-CO TaxID=2866381 RepID=UPI00217D914D|nr:deoxyribodipyrimidine photo-lyase [Halalkaliarchaeum sp. AArc-CO]UWG51495.1 Deoxyribodipyrimidine photolyase [Halalkaliarchaeum sp. AArc-CO]
MELFWHRRDLRIADNRGLAAAGDGSSEAASIFVFDDAVLEHAASPRVAFMLDALSALREQYREHDSQLLIARGDPATILPNVATELEVDRVVWNRDYSGLARERDAGVRRALDAVDLPRESFHDAVHHDPDAIRTNAGDPYSVFTYYWKKWRDREKDSPYPPPNPDDLVDAERVRNLTSALECALETLPSIDELGFSEPDAEIQSAGTEASRRRLREFCDGPICRYEHRRDYPADGTTSRLSADLKWGTIGVREVWEATVEAAEAIEAREDSEGDDGTDGDDGTVGAEKRESVEEFQSQLAWREFYTQVLFHNPEVVSENYREYENPIEWENDPELIDAWKDGETGYPIVDAGMRQLRTEAYMHNRVRMIVASFLTKDLLVDWRYGYEWFKQKLADHDTGNDTGGWQWAASTGTDAQPYFRIFNPMTQGERYDPDAEYIQTYVPELAGVDPEVIHEWHELSETERHRIAPGYPEPIVDHSRRRELALEMFERARGEEN